MCKHKSYVIAGICMSLFLAGCGSKEAANNQTTPGPKNETSEATLDTDTSESKSTAADSDKEETDSAEKTAEKTSGKINLKDEFKGTFIVDGLEITLPCRIETLENKEEFLSHYEKLYEYSDGIITSSLEFQYDNDILPMEKRIITAAYISSFENTPIDVTLPNGSSLLIESEEEMLSSYGTPDNTLQAVSSDEVETSQNTYDTDYGSLNFDTYKYLVDDTYQFPPSLAIFANSSQVDELKQSMFEEAGKTSDSWRSGLFKVDDKIYSTYSVLDEFSMNGWDFHPKHESLAFDYILKPGETEDKESPLLILDNEENYLRFSVKNRLDEERPLIYASILQVTSIFSDVPFELPGGIKKGSSMNEVKALYGEPVSIKEMKNIEAPYQNIYPDFTANYYMNSADGWETEDVALCVYSDSDGNVCGFRYRNNTD